MLICKFLKHSPVHWNMVLKSADEGTSHGTVQLVFKRGQEAKRILTISLMEGV